MRIGSWNLDTNLGRLEDGYAKEAFSQWKISCRIPQILNFIKEQNLDIIQIQEVRKCLSKNGLPIDSIIPISVALTEMGFTVIIQPYNPAKERSFCYITGYRGVNCVGHYPFWFTKTPRIFLNRANMSREQIKKHNFGETYEKCCLVTEFEINGARFNCVNLHLTIPWEGRRESTRLLSGLLDSFDVPFVCAGDFNSFPDWNGPEQLSCIKYDDAIGNYNSSFIAFPYDFGKDHDRLIKCGFHEKLNRMNVEEKRNYIIDLYTNECSALGGCLDHMFHNGWLSANGEIILTCEDKIELSGKIELDEKTIKKYVLEKIKKNKPAFASDHQLAVGSFEFKKNI